MDTMLRTAVDGISAFACFAEHIGDSGFRILDGLLDFRVCLSSSGLGGLDFVKQSDLSIRPIILGIIHRELPICRCDSVGSGTESPSQNSI